MTNISSLMYELLIHIVCKDKRCILPSINPEYFISENYITTPSEMDIVFLSFAFILPSENTVYDCPFRMELYVNFTMNNEE